MVNHFRGRIQYYALWNEQDITYWNPIGNPEEYGRLLKAFVPAVHETDPQAKVIYGGLADPSSDFARRSLDACQCAARIDVFAYHTYPGYGQNLNPESMDYGAYGPESPVKLRETVRTYPGIRKDIPFWDDEFNSIPSWEGSDESVQAKYIPRGLVYNWAAGVRTFVWLLAAGVDGNEYDDFGIIHGLRNLPDDFTPRPVFHALQNTNALFSDTKLDPSIKIETHPMFRAFGDRAARRSCITDSATTTGRRLSPIWVAAHSVAGRGVRATTVNLAEAEELRHSQPCADRCRLGRDHAARMEGGHHRYAANVPRARQHPGDRRCELFRLAGAAGGAQRPDRTIVRGRCRVELGTARRCYEGGVIERRPGDTRAWERILLRIRNALSPTHPRRPVSVSYRVRAVNAPAHRHSRTSFA